MTARIFPIFHSFLPSNGSSNDSQFVNAAPIRETNHFNREGAPKWLSPSREQKSLVAVEQLKKQIAGTENITEPLWDALVNALQQGMLVLSRNLQLVYANEKAREICQMLLSEQQMVGLPSEVSEICHRLTREGTSDGDSLVVEYLAPNHQTIRLYTCWLDLEPGATTEPAYILIRMENCHETLLEELRIERKKYDLTEREAEIWLLLRQECTYQAIAKSLQISLNTVKTHVKNLYAKKRSFQGQEKVVVF
ncbi:MAG: helix-turn-helix transcriptional regulator [Scytolyngbya sp. HA4215-MV1]|nr:helix-turn-helix transcriptional regulator [Scytolyngbya sp. HA4215-MV1]